MTPGVRYPRRRGVALFTALAVGYFTLGAVLIIRYDIFDWDALSRVANAGFTLMSRDPHLAAVGFVWNPLPSLVQIPFLPLSYWWPGIKTYGLTGNLQSALFMAGSALVVRRIALDRGVGDGWRRVAVACYALNPMIVLYGASGMSEAALLFCSLWCVLYLLRWTESARVVDLAGAGVALGVGYLTRYELIPAACGAAAFVVLVSLLRSPPGSRLQQTALNLVLALFPFVTAVIGWAVTGWVVTGEVFGSVQSQYGNAAQVATALARGGLDLNSDAMVVVERLFGMQPFVGLAVILAACLVVVRRSLAALAPVAVFGAMLTFSAWGHYSASTFGWFRFYLVAIPLVIVVALVCWAPRPTPPPPPARRWLGTPESRWGAALLAASLLIGTPVTAVSMFTDGNSVNQPLQLGLQSLLSPDRYPLEERWFRQMSAADRFVADYLDQQHLPDGSVLYDTFTSPVVWLTSERPRQFVVTSDQDFKAALNRPRLHGVRYVLISNPAISAAQDAVTRRYPSFWYDGAGIATLLLSVDGPDGIQRWRLFRVNEPDERDR
ncbi:Predicted membrane protein [Mycolicibacterium phlei]|nr:hypothetical protein MPHLCCUG_04648 [Mycolicibacterium phlei]STZ21891.1 Predicted membrane protein [Mycolicibacterium phlei]VEG11528.1 Predicted membrane protein [Mycobacteroides chelonae]